MFLLKTKVCISIYLILLWPSMVFLCFIYNEKFEIYIKIKWIDFDLFITLLQKKKKTSLWGDGPLVESLPCKPEDLSLDPRMDAKSRHGDTCLWSLCLSILHIKRLLFVLMSLIEFYSKTHFFVGKSNAHTSFHYWILVQ